MGVDRTRRQEERPDKFRQAEVVARRMEGGRVGDNIDESTTISTISTNRLRYRRTGRGSMRLAPPSRSTCPPPRGKGTFVPPPDPFAAVPPESSGRCTPPPPRGGAKKGTRSLARLLARSLARSLARRPTTSTPRRGGGSGSAAAR